MIFANLDKLPPDPILGVTAAFRADPEWEKLRSTPGYTDAEIVTDINNLILAPTAYSQV